AGYSPVTWMRSLDTRLETLVAIVICPGVAAPAIYTLSLHDALPICGVRTLCDGFDSRNQVRQIALGPLAMEFSDRLTPSQAAPRSEEHTSELQSRFDLVCRLLLEKKKNAQQQPQLHLDRQVQSEPLH